MPEIERMLRYANRVGVTIARHGATSEESEVEKYLNRSGLLKNKPGLIRMDVMKQDADETRIIEGIKALISMTAG